MTTPRLVCRAQRMPWLLYASGRHYAHWVDCGRWSCPKCARDKLVGIAVHLVGLQEKVWELSVPPRLNRAVRDALRNSNSLRLYLPGGGMHLVVDRETSGYGWVTVPRDSMDVATGIRTWVESGLRVPRRTVWTGDWVPPAEVVEADSDPLLYKRVFSSGSEAAEWLARYGVDVRLQTWPVVDPEQTAARMRTDDTQSGVRFLL